MRSALRFAALGVLVMGVVFWLFGGPNLGWTRTQVPVTRVDAVTELEYVEWQRNFVPGVDFVGACGLVAAMLFGASWLGRGPGAAPPGSAGAG